MVCGGPSHPGRALNGLRVEGRKEGGGGGSHRRATPARIPPPKGPTRREHFSRVFRDRRRRARAYSRLIRSFSSTATGDRIPLFLSSFPSSLAPQLSLLREGDRGGLLAWLPSVELGFRVTGRGRRKRRRRRRNRRKQKRSDRESAQEEEGDRVPSLSLGSL